MIFNQTGDTYRAMTEAQQERLIATITEALMFMEEKEQEKIIGYLKRADESLGTRIEKGL